MKHFIQYIASKTRAYTWTYEFEMQLYWSVENWIEKWGVHAYSYCTS